MVRLMKNAFVPINRIPYEVLSIIPDYWAGEDTENEFKYPTDKDLITLTHVCHDWRELFISRPSLWTRLDCMSVEKTRVCVCVCFYYTPFSSVARGVRYLLQRLWFI